MTAVAQLTRVLAVAGGFLASACTAILVPDDDETIVWCDLTSDCPDIEDNRYVAVCVIPDNLDPGADKVCSVDYDPLPCAGDDHGPSALLTHAYLEALGDPQRYAACPAELRGQRGCGPAQDGSCAEGLIENVYGTCDDPDAPVLSVGAGQLELDEIQGRDIQDQFCRAYYCDERFVCSHRGPTPRCVPCDPARFFGRAGCGTLYLQGQPSPAYLDASDHGNCSGDQLPTTIEIGPLGP